MTSTTTQTDERTAALVIMAKAPQPGLAKTRLIPALGAQRAAQLARQLLTHTLETAVHTQRFSHIELCVTPEPHDPIWTTVGLPTTNLHVALTDQGDGDLGARMQRAFERLLPDHDMVVMIGTDAPDIGAELLDQAKQDLIQQDAVFVPAFDGGYTLIGLNQTQTKHLSDLFIDIPWSTSQVMTITRDRLHGLNANWHEYAPMADIDEPDDLAKLPVGWHLKQQER